MIDRSIANKPKQELTQVHGPTKNEGSNGRWTGFDGLSFTQDWEKDAGGDQQKGYGVYIHTSGQDGSDAGYVPKADPVADVLDLDKSYVDAFTSVFKAMPKGGNFGEGLKNIAEATEKTVGAVQNGQEAFKKKPDDSTHLYKVNIGDYNGIKKDGDVFIKNGDTLFGFREIDSRTGDTSQYKTEKVH